MHVKIHPNTTRGVTQLMYVGDVPETPLASPVGTLALLFGLGFLAGKTRGVLRLAAAGGAVWLGVRAAQPLTRP